MAGHNFNSTVLREYDVRGIVDETLNTGDAYALGQAYGTKLKSQGGSRVCVGRDGRVSSPAMEQALVDGLKSTGAHVIRIGLSATPMLYYSVFELEADGGIMVTGSHNPPNYNGFKMMMLKKSVFGAAIQELGQIAAQGEFANGEGSEEEQELLARYVDRILRDFGGSTMKVAWDTANGAAGPAVEAMVAKMPGEHIVINAEVDGTFPSHPADPTVEANLEQLKEVVLREGCDLGFSFDGDGDRIGAVDRHGRVIWGDQILAILAGELLQELPGAPIIADVKASQALFDRIEALGGQPVMWKTGHSLIKTKMQELEAPLAGEMSGHIFFKHKFYGHDDAMYAGLRLLNAIASQGGDLAALKDGLPAAINTPELRFDCDEERKFIVIDEVRTRLEERNTDMFTGDGVRVNTNDGWWLLRASNTQAVLVARAESDTDEGLGRLKAALVAELLESGIQPPAGF